MRTIFYLTFLLLSQFVLSQPTKLESIILKSPRECKKKITDSSRVKLHYVSTIFDSNKEYENVTVDINPGNKDQFPSGFLDGIQGMCSGEIRRLIVPAHLHIFKSGHTVDTDKKAMIYEIQVLDISRPLFTPGFWAGIAFIAAAYVFISKKAKDVEAKKEAIYKKKMEDKSS